ncbi:MAG TPA: peptidyl-prolyl cis-trans isomerase [Thermoleophilaceae bacterium]|nr:peptidyl-prolyl cis-trans isomerase [Thermoleophilaceae bacterium]
MTLPRLTFSRSFATIALTGVCAVLIAGCGDDVPSNSVAKVGDTNITKDEFNRWLTNAASGQQQGGGQAVIPDPPDYKKCVAGLKKQLSAQKGAPKQSDAALKKQCKTQYDQLKGEVMQFLIQAQWVQQEAEDRDVEVSDAEVKKSFNQQKKQAFPKEADYKKFLKDSGMNEEDILYRVKLDQLQTKLTQKVSKDKVKITNADIDAYYAKNKKRFAQPQRRDLNVVLTKTKAKADQAKAALESGDSFKTVSKKYSIDQASKAQGGKLPDLAKGKQDPALDKAAFAAKKDTVVGPVKTQFGYYVFEVTAVKAASQQSLAQARDTIRNLLRSQREQKALDSFVKDFRKKYKEETNCGEDYRVAECKNAPKSSTETAPGGAAPQGADPTQQGGAAPQGAAPQGAPADPTQQGGAAAPQQAPQAPQAPQGSGATPQTPSSPAPTEP